MGDFLRVSSSVQKLIALRTSMIRLPHKWVCGGFMLHVSVCACRFSGKRKETTYLDPFGCVETSNKIGFPYVSL